MRIGRRHFGARGGQCQRTARTGQECRTIAQHPVKPGIVEWTSHGLTDTPREIAPRDFRQALRAFDRSLCTDPQHVRALLFKW